jgi:hypothetical protein
MIPKGTTTRNMRRVAAAGLMAALLGGCVTGGPLLPPMDEAGVGSREAQFRNMAALQDYRSCRDDAIAIDAEARKSAQPGRYLAAAALLEKCERGLGEDAEAAPLQERMRAYALAVVDYAKGGDIAKSRTTLDRFKSHFPDHDLRFADGGSFIQTAEMLLGVRDRASPGTLAASDIGDRTRGEMRRLRYWLRN